MCITLRRGSNRRARGRFAGEESSGTAPVSWHARCSSERRANWSGRTELARDSVASRSCVGRRPDRSQKRESASGASDGAGEWPRSARSSRSRRPSERALRRLDVLLRRGAACAGAAAARRAGRRLRRGSEGIRGAVRTTWSRSRGDLPEAGSLSPLLSRVRSALPGADSLLVGRWLERKPQARPRRPRGVLRRFPRDPRPVARDPRPVGLDPGSVGLEPALRARHFA